MKTFREVNENYASLYGYYDEVTKTLHITRPNGQTFNVKSTVLSAPGVKVFGVSAIGDSIGVYIGPVNNPQPLQIAKFSSSGYYMGTSLMSN